MIKILFVCHGNICRSPMAEFVMKDLAEKRGVSEQFEIASAACSAEELGNPVYPPARRELSRHGISCAGKTARRITKQDYDDYDVICYMDRSNARYLSAVFPDPEHKIRPLLNRDVADPWYSGDFSATWDDILLGCTKLLEEFTAK